MNPRVEDHSGARGPLGKSAITMSTDIAEWLRGLGLERYEPAFRENEIDWASLPRLTEQDLKDLGVEVTGAA
jgi:hypothetical protein